MHQLVGDVLVVDRGEELALVVEATLAGLGDQLLRVGAEVLRLGLGGDDGLGREEVAARLAIISLLWAGEPPKRAALRGLGIVSP